MANERQQYKVPTIYKEVRQGGFSADAPLTVSVPGSKSITNRALLLAALAKGRSVLSGVLFSDDSRHFVQCLQTLGFSVLVNEAGKEITVEGLGGSVPLDNAKLYVGSAGTAARFLTAWLGLSHGVYGMDASEQMRRRPMAPLLASLRELGCDIACENDGHFPFTLRSHGFQKDNISVNIENSSQFLSALLIASFLSGNDFTTRLEGEHGMAYIEMTVKMMEQFGVRTVPLYYCNGNAANHDCVGCINSSRPYAYRTAAGQHYTARAYTVEPDVSAACYFYALSPLLGISVRVPGVRFDSLQGDVAFIRLLEKMGCRATDTAEGILLEPPADGRFHGITADMSACSDQAITLAALAPFADSPTTITGIGHIRFQESDRISAIVTELRKMGIDCTETADSITILPGAPAPCTVNTYEDHRMAMGFSLIGLRSAGIVIDNPGCCRKTFENYFDVLDGVVRSLAATEAPVGVVANPS